MIDCVVKIMLRLLIDQSLQKQYCRKQVLKFNSLIVSSRVPGGAAQDLRLKPIKLSSKSSKTIKHGSIPDPIQLDPRRKGLTNYRMFRSSTSRSDPIRAAIDVL